MFDLTGMTALVTGASGGIGSEIARALAAQGARLAISGSNAAKLDAFLATLGGDHVALPCDLSDPAAVDALVGLVSLLGSRRAGRSMPGASASASCWIAVASSCIRASSVRSWSTITRLAPRTESTTSAMPADARYGSW